jgi:hypothetical protein
MESTVTTQDVNDGLSMLDSNDISDTATVVTSSGGLPPKSKSSRRSSFGWNTIRSSIRMSFVGGSSSMNAYLEGNMNNYEESQDQNESSQSATANIYTSPVNVPNSSSSRRSLLSSKNNPSSGSLNQLDRNSEDSASVHSTPLLPKELKKDFSFLNPEDLQQFIGNVNFGSNAVEMEILNNPYLFIVKDDSELTLFLRTYFYHIISLTSFFTK